MPTQKVFKSRVRARMTKTGESYTTARMQLLRKAPNADEPTSAPAEAGVSMGSSHVDLPEDLLLVADDAMRRATGKGHAEWFAILDEWGATEHNHTEIARWLTATYQTPGWWTQNLTVAYERARGLRKPGQMADGFSVGVTRTVAVDPERALEAFTDPTVRERWLPGTSVTQRPTRAARTARFDWAEPPSRIVVTVAPKDDSRTIVSITHEQLPDPAAAEQLKTNWRRSADALKALLERG